MFFVAVYALARLMVMKVGRPPSPLSAVSSINPLYTGLPEVSLLPSGPRYFPVEGGGVRRGIEPRTGTRPDGCEGPGTHSPPSAW